MRSPKEVVRIGSTGFETDRKDYDMNAFVYFRDKVLPYLAEQKLVGKFSEYMRLIYSRYRGTSDLDIQAGQEAVEPVVDIAKKLYDQRAVSTEQLGFLGSTFANEELEKLKNIISGHLFQRGRDVAERYGLRFEID